MRTWTELRSFNGDKLIREMIRLGKHKMIGFKLNCTSDKSWVVMPLDKYEEFVHIETELKRLKKKLETIQNVATL